MADPRSDPLGFVVDQLAAGNTPENTVDALVLHGHSRSDAELHVRDVLGAVDREVKREVRHAAPDELLVGIGLLALGGILTGITYAGASPSGNYIIFSGLVAVGAVAIVRGLLKMLRP